VVGQRTEWLAIFIFVWVRRARHCAANAASDWMDWQPRVVK